MKIIYYSLIILTLFFGIQIVNAGNLSPSGLPSATMYTIEDIYLRLTTNATATEADHAFSPSVSPSGTMYTLKQIYEAIPTINPANVKDGVTYLGVTGTLSAGGYTYGDNNQAFVLGTAASPGTALVNLFSGSGTQFGDTAIIGGTQANGGLDDYNNGVAPAVGRYVGLWTVCNVGNSYCGTGDDAAKVRDDSTGLVWSYSCSGVECSSLNTETGYLIYTWDNSGGNNNGKTAQQLCTDGAHGKSGWYLPHQKQLLQAYINGSYGVLEEEGVVTWNYWSATSVSSQIRSWVVNLSNGFTASTNRNAGNRLRCVKSS
jgi:hypothetical protein